MQIYKDFTFRYIIDQQLKILVYIYIYIFFFKKGASSKIVEFLLQLNSVKTQATSTKQKWILSFIASV